MEDFFYIHSCFCRYLGKHESITTGKLHSILENNVTKRYTYGTECIITEQLDQIIYRILLNLRFYVKLTERFRLDKK